MTVVTSFAPIVNPNATILILGSMPGIASLTAQQYYAHPRNAFWPIMSAVFQIDLNLPYGARVKALQQTNVAVWDVLQQCERAGSLDSAIQKETRYPNEFKGFFQQHDQLEMIVFNGAEAEKSFKKMVLPEFEQLDYELVRAPSTSPAYTIRLTEKINHWQALLVEA